MEEFSYEQIETALSRFDEGYNKGDEKPGGIPFSKEELWNMLEEEASLSGHTAEDLVIAVEQGF